MSPKSALIFRFSKRPQIRLRNISFNQFCVTKLKREYNKISYLADSSSSFERGKYNGNRTSYIPKSTLSTTNITVSNELPWFSKKRRTVPEIKNLVKYILLTFPLNNNFRKQGTIFFIQHKRDFFYTSEIMFWSWRTLPT